MLPKEIFLSHSSKDRAYANNLATALRDHKLKVWYSDANIRNAKQWHDEIGNALKRCDWFIILLSKNSVISEWVKRELLYALRKQQYKEHILPILCEECDFEELSWTLENFQMVDCKNGKKLDYQKILDTWNIACNSKWSSN